MYLRASDTLRKWATALKAEENANNACNDKVIMKLLQITACIEVHAHVQTYKPQCNAELYW
jgi:hypothetical protein